MPQYCTFASLPPETAAAIETAVAKAAGARKEAARPVVA